MPVSPELLATIDLLPESVSLVGLDGEILAVNSELSRQLEMPRESLAGRHFGQIAADPWNTVSEYLHRCARSEQRLRGSITLRRENGTSFGSSVSGAGLRLPDSTGPARAVLLRWNPKSESTEFLALLAHELRNPLAPIRNALQVMRVAEGDHAVTTAARSMIERQLQHLVRLIDDLTAEPARSPLDAATPLSKPLAHLRTRILVADDNHDAAQSLAFMLEIEGHDVRIAHDGLEAMELAETFRPQIALLDIGMPRLDGYGTARQLRARPWGGSVCLVALTGWGQEEDRRRTREAGFDRHLVKPVDPDMLNALIVQTLLP